MKLEKTFIAQGQTGGVKRDDLQFLKFTFGIRSTEVLTMNVIVNGYIYWQNEMWKKGTLQLLELY